MQLGNYRNLKILAKSECNFRYVGWSWIIIVLLRCLFFASYIYSCDFTYAT